MTIKEIATTAGCSDKTIRRWIAERMPGKLDAVLEDLPTNLINQAVQDALGRKASK